MECTYIQQEMISYLYNEMAQEERKKCEDHMVACSDCTQQLNELKEVLGIVSKSTVEKWNVVTIFEQKKQKRSRKIFLRILPIAAVLLFSFLLGFILGKLYLPKKNVAIVRVDVNEVLMILAQNQKYRHTLSRGQLKLIQEMEKKLVVNTKLELEISELHQLEKLQYSEGNTKIIVAQKTFLQKHKDSFLTAPIRISLAKKLHESNLYEEASQVYKAILADTFISPDDRGKYMWQLSLCYEKNNTAYAKLLQELEKDSSYGVFQWKASKCLADLDFNNLQFSNSYNRYLEYTQKSNVKDKNVKEKMEWIRYHERDNYYPLMLYVQAKQKGTASYYGLKIIITQYPDSPLAYPSFKMYMQNRETSLASIHRPAFPEKQDAKTLVAYLSDISTENEFEEIAKFAKYCQAKIYEKELQDIPQALHMYKQIIEESNNHRLQEIAYKRINDIKNLRRK